MHDQFIEISFTIYMQYTLAHANIIKLSFCGIYFARRVIRIAFEHSQQDEGVFDICINRVRVYHMPDRWSPSANVVEETNYIISPNSNSAVFFLLLHYSPVHRSERSRNSLSPQCYDLLTCTMASIHTRNLVF